MVITTRQKRQNIIAKLSTLLIYNETIKIADIYSLRGSD